MNIEADLATAIYACCFVVNALNAAFSFVVLQSKFWLFPATLGAWCLAAFTMYATGEWQ